MQGWNGRLETLLDWAGRHLWLFTSICFVGMIVLCLFGAPFDEVLRDDALGYLVKAFEITRGDWTPTLQHFEGWAMFLALCLKISGITGLFEAMVFTRMVSILLAASLLFPLAALTVRVFDRRTALFVVVAFALSRPMVTMGPFAYTESLFLHLVLGSLFFLVRDTRPRGVVLATVIGSLAYYVRPNGVFLLLVILAAVLFWMRGRMRIGFLLLTPILFFLFSTPHLALRAAAYGSPFESGMNSKLWVDSYQEASSSNVEAISALEYFRTHDLQDYSDRFLRDGLLGEIKALRRLVGPRWLAIFGIGVLGWLFRGRDRKLGVILIGFAVFFGGVIPVYGVFGLPRHLVMLVPLIFITGAGFFVQIAGRRGLGKLLLLALIGVILWQSPAYRLKRGIEIVVPEVRDEWAIWAADNLKGKFALIEGTDLVWMTLPTLPRISGWNWEENLEFAGYRPGFYSSIEEALVDFEARGYDYLFLDSDHIERRPYLHDVYDERMAGHFELIRSFRSRPEDQWNVPDMDIFRIHY